MDWKIPSSSAGLSLNILNSKVLSRTSSEDISTSGSGAENEEPWDDIEIPPDFEQRAPVSLASKLHFSSSASLTRSTTPEPAIKQNLF